MLPVGFEPTFSVGDRPQTYALDRAANGNGPVPLCPPQITVNRTWTLAESARSTGHILRVHTLRLGHENQQVDAVCDNNDSWPHVLWAERRIFSVKPGGARCNH
jgi:hypothetical protein